LVFSKLLTETFLIVRRTGRDMIRQLQCSTVFYSVLYVKHSLFLSDFNETWIFSINFRKVLKFKFQKKKKIR